MATVEFSKFADLLSAGLMASYFISLCYIYIYIYKYKLTCVTVHIHAHTHTHTHTHKLVWTGKTAEMKDKIF